MNLDLHDNSKRQWMFPLGLVFARFTLAFAIQAFLALVLSLSGTVSAWDAAGHWWIVYGSLIDLGCILLIIRFLKKESLNIFDLIGFDRSKLRNDIVLGLLFTILFVLLAATGGIAAGAMIYGGETPPHPMQSLPLIAALYALIIWPIFWGFAEQTTYMGYALPRLKQWTGRAWLAILIIAIGWGLQHAAMPFQWDMQWASYRFLSTLPIALVLPAIYLKLGRLLPFIIAHALADMMAVYSGLWM